MFFLYLKLICQALIKIDIAKHLLNVFIFEYKFIACVRTSDYVFSLIYCNSNIINSSLTLTKVRTQAKTYIFYKIIFFMNYLSYNKLSVGCVKLVFKLTIFSCFQRTLPLVYNYRRHTTKNKSKRKYPLLNGSKRSTINVQTNRKR